MVGVLNAYPNPNNGTFTVKSTAKAELNLVNSLGQTVKTIRLDENNGYTGDVSGLASGVYFIVSQQSAHTTTKKIIVTH